MTQIQFVLESGRAVGLSALGDPLARRLVLFFHPTPGAGGFDPNPIITNSWGVQMMALDRPGYGGSDPLDDTVSASIQLFAEDSAQFLVRSEQIARQLSNGDYGRVGAVGWGTGGAVALSLAARHPDLIDRVATIGLGRPAELLRQVRARTSSDLIRAPWFEDPDIDKYPGLENRIERMVDNALTAGPAGLANDRMAVHDKSWSTELTQITAPALLIYGQRDDVTAAGNGRWYQKRIKSARVATVQDVGQIAIVAVWRRILAHVAPQGQDALGSRLPSG